MVFCITYRKYKYGLYGVASKSRRIRGRNSPVKDGQYALGYVIDKGKNIFYNEQDGFFQFDKKTGTKTPADPADIPPAFLRKDCKDTVQIDFGDSFFLNQLLFAIGFDQVINSVHFHNNDSLYAMIHYYVLCGLANRHALAWYKSNYVSFLYPRANIASQRISDLLMFLGRSEVRRRFLMEHIEYILQYESGAIEVIIDSSDMENSSEMEISHVVTENGKMVKKFKLVAIVLRKSGLPIYYEPIEGNIIDVSTVERLMSILEQYKCSVTYCLADAGYYCKSNIERLLLLGVDFTMRMNPHYNAYKEAVDSNLEALENPENLINYHGRRVYVKKISSLIGLDKETGAEKYGFIFLCKDVQSAFDKGSKLSQSKKTKELTNEEYIHLTQRLGVFAIVSTKDLDTEEVLPEYYLRQRIEQYFDYAKNYVKFLPTRVHSEQALRGHMLLALIASFLVIVTKNKLKTVDNSYSPQLNGEKPDPFQDVLNESPISVFSALRGQKAEIFPRVIIPNTPTKQVNDVLGAFGFESPVTVYRFADGMEPVYKEQPKGISKEEVLTASFIPEELKKKSDKKNVKDTETTSKVNKEEKSGSKDKKETRSGVKKSSGKTQEHAAEKTNARCASTEDLSAEGQPKQSGANGSKGGNKGKKSGAQDKKHNTPKTDVNNAFTEEQFAEGQPKQSGANGAEGGNKGQESGAQDKKHTTPKADVNNASTGEQFAEGQPKQSGANGAEGGKNRGKSDAHTKEHNTSKTDVFSATIEDVSQEAQPQETLVNGPEDARMGEKAADQSEACTAAKNDAFSATIEDLSQEAQPQETLVNGPEDARMGEKATDQSEECTAAKNDAFSATIEDVSQEAQPQETLVNGPEDARMGEKAADQSEEYTDPKNDTFSAIIEDVSQEAQPQETVINQSEDGSAEKKTGGQAEKDADNISAQGAKQQDCVADDCGAVKTQKKRGVKPGTKRGSYRQKRIKSKEFCSDFAHLYAVSKGLSEDIEKKIFENLMSAI